MLLNIGAESGPNQKQIIIIINITFDFTFNQIDCDYDCVNEHFIIN